MKKLISIFAILAVFSAASRVPLCNAEDSVLMRMESGDLDLSQLKSALQYGDFKRAEEIATIRSSEELFLLGSMQELQFKCKESKETYKEVLRLNPLHHGAKVRLGDGLCSN